ncbi:MAG: alpha/beta fold hydrolase [Anaerolineales bacterium]|nr:alpha/beta fold hydrolase [Anaerolineales bacterium]
MTPMNTPHPLIKNPHLEGDAFHWPAGRTGILLIHGLTATTAEMRPLAKRLHAKGFTIAGPVLPGHNTRPEDLNTVHWRDWVATVEQAYAALAARCDRVFVGGESTGGVLSFYLGIHHPEIAGILTYAPALKLQLTTFEKLQLRLLAPLIPYRPRIEAEDDGLAWKGYQVIHLRGALQLIRMSDYVQARLAEIRRPVLVIQGRLDETVHPEVPEMILNQVSSVLKEAHWMEHSRHCVVLDQELDQVTELTLDFIAKVQG